MALSKVNIGRIADDGAVKSVNIVDGTITNADVNACAAIVSTKTDTMTTTQKNNAQMNVALLGFKMAVTESLTVFNLVDGVVDEFHDESGTDEGEGSNDTYCASSDNYINQVEGSPVSYSGAIGATGENTESDTFTTNVTAGSPNWNSGTAGVYTVPTGATALNIYAWGAGGGGTDDNPGEWPDGGGGGYAEGTLAVTGGQTLVTFVGLGGGGAQPNNGPYGGWSGGGWGNPEGGGGGGITGVFAGYSCSPQAVANAKGVMTAPQAVVIAGAGGGAGTLGEPSDGGAGGGLTGLTDGGNAQTGTEPGPMTNEGGGGGDQEQGGQAWSGPAADGNGGLFYGGPDGPDPEGEIFAGGGAGYYGGGRGRGGPNFTEYGGGGGGSSYYGHPQVTSGSTATGQNTNSGGEPSPLYTAANFPGFEGQPGPVPGGNINIGDGGGNKADGIPGAMLFTTTGQPLTTSSTTIVSNAFTASSAPSTSRIVVFQENVDSITLNTDLIASISRDGGTTFTTVTLADEGYVTGASGQRILSGVATVSGQPSGTSMRWKLALANNASKIHGVSLSWG
tara:strand:+ start:42 stop:1730 length:1689 start_codon:yes stop_codon:yes gene_type:complete